MTAPAPAGTSVWMAARARNALRRGMLLGTAALLLSLVALVALALVPRGTVRSAMARQARVGTMADTASLLAELRRHTDALGNTEEGLERARLAARALASRQAAIDSAGGPEFAVSPERRPQRDSLLMVAASLDQLVSRAETAPLPTSYRAIAESWALRGTPRVAALLDTLTAIERERESFDAAGSADPAYVALTTRVNEIGRELLQIASARRGSARATLAAMTAAQQAIVPPPAVDDTTARLAAAANLRARVAFVADTLERVRAHNSQVAAAQAEARRDLAAVPQPAALAAAALVLGFVGAFGVALAAEMRRPHLADAAEAARVTGTRVLAVISAPDGSGSAPRTRRSADRDTPPLLDPMFEQYRLLYLQVAATGATIPLVTVTGDEPEVTAVVAANLAAASGFEARATLLVDGDLEHGLIARVMRIPREPGLSAILMGEEEWARSIVSTPVGRNRYVDAIPAGRPPSGPATRERAEQVRRDLQRYAARYDLCVLCAPADIPEQGDLALLPTPDVILCAREGHTPLARLTSMVDALRGAGTRLRGVVVWRADVPRLAARVVEDGAARQAMSWTETRQAVARR